MSSREKVIWVTRTIEGAHRTAQAFEARGLTAIIAPVLAIHPLEINIDNKAFDAVIFTSRNGLDAFAAASPRRDTTAWCVGDATAEAARATGFTEVISAEGDVAALFERIKTTAPRTTRFLYAAPKDPAAPLLAWMWAEGFKIQQVAVYETVVIDPDLSPDDLKKITHVALHSPRAARAVAAWLSAHAAPSVINALSFVCLSEAVWQAFAAAAPEGFYTHRIAAAPDEENLLKLVT